MNYITQTDLEHYMDVALTGNGQNMFNDMLPRMQAMIDQECNRTWNFTNAVIETFDAMQSSAQPKTETTFFPMHPISITAANPSFPQAGGVISIIVGKVNGAGGTTIDLTYVYNYRTHVKFWTWALLTNLFNPFGYQAVEITYNSDDAGAPPDPIKQALIEWIARKIKTSQQTNKETTLAQADTVRMVYKADQIGGIPDFVKRVCDQYRIPTLDHF